MKAKLALTLFLFIMALVAGIFLYIAYAEIPLEKHTVTKKLPDDYFTNKLRL